MNTLHEISIAQLGYGCMRFPVDGEGRIDQQNTNALIARAMECGVRYYDTAWPYHGGASEGALATALSPYPRDSYQLATKLPSWEIKTTQQAAERLEQQLERLNTDYVDYYLLHALDRNRWKQMVDGGIVAALAELQQQGKIRQFGFSFHDAYEIFEEILSYRNWDFCQIQLNYMDTAHQAGMRGYHLATQKGVPLVIMEPLKGGMLTQLPLEMGAPMTSLAPEKSVASWGFRWLATLPNVKVILSGMTTMDQLDDNLDTFQNIEPLSEGELAAVTEVSHAIKAKLKNGCTACQYCLPCPAGVDIPHNFRVWNVQSVFGVRNEVARLWAFLDPEERAGNCVGCGKCEVKCPQMIPIRQHLQQVQADVTAFLGQ